MWSQTPLSSLFTASSSVNHTTTVPLCAWQESAILDIMDRPVYIINMRQYRGKNFDLGIKFFLNGQDNPDIAKIISEFWVPQIKYKARDWLLAYGLIPYRIINDGGIETPQICDLESGFIYVCKDLKTNKNVYMFQSMFAQKNKSKFTNGYMSYLEYDKDVKFFVVGTEAPDHDGYFRSTLSKFVPDYFIVLKNAMWWEEINEQKTLKTGVIEEKPISSKEQLDFIERRSKMFIRAVNSDANRPPPQQPNAQDRLGTESRTRREEIRGIAFNLMPSRYTPPIEENGITFLKPMQTFKQLKLQEPSSKQEDMEDRFDRKLAIALGVSFNAWDIGSKGTMSDVYLINTQTTMATTLKTELKTYSNLVKEWYWKIFGKQHLLTVKTKNKNKKGKKNIPAKTRIFSFGKGRIDKDKDPIIKSKEIAENYKKRTHNWFIKSDKLDPRVLNMLFDIRVEFIRRPFAARPDPQGLEEKWLGGAIDDEVFWEVNTDLFGVPFKRVTKEQYMENLAKSQKPSMELQTEMQSKLQTQKMETSGPEKQQPQQQSQQQKQQRRQPSMPRPFDLTKKKREKERLYQRRRKI